MSAAVSAKNRFYSYPLGPSHLWRALMYVDLNPVRAGSGTDVCPIGLTSNLALRAIPVWYICMGEEDLQCR
jgi:hypothetical protein